MRRPFVLAALCAFAAAPALVAGAQTKDNVVDPGMSKVQVIEHLGQPQSLKTSDTTLYMYYKNGCEKTCGMNDVVILVHDKVVDAIFRDPNRKYTGESSSPNAISAAEARKTGAAMAKGGSSARPAPPPPSGGKAEVMPAPKPIPAPPSPVPAAMPPVDSTKKDTMPKPPAKADTAAPKPPAE